MRFCRSLTDLDFGNRALSHRHNLIDEPVADNLAFDLAEHLRAFRAVALLNGKNTSELANPEPNLSVVASVVEMEECTTHTNVGQVELHLAPCSRLQDFEPVWLPK